ncbi:hypothetical protein M752DRAFT_268665 [Aspergillus phoenicis ATCC 13157]|uniref:Uncharacterized protein n=1 Tax=Aspergillus phoenicis ATCC 13157 TaxID=1353007 RepID=A0A370PBQ9_ASPPH|nr:hypothetical protein M752DRAFT_268665 [Aspergillus phoenicis ATCC 13157]
MAAHLRFLFGRSTQDQVRHQEVRALVINKMSETFEAVANHEAAWIEPNIQETLGVICEDLHISKRGTNQDELSPVFFEPLGTHNVPQPHPTQDQGQKLVKEIFENWDKPTPRPPTVTDQIYMLMYRIENILCTSARDFESEYGWSNTLSDYAKWIECGDIIPELVAEEFEGPLYGSPRNQLNRPHTLLATLTKSDADERLSRYEAVVILTVMLSRLEGDECLNHNVIPVMVISVFPGFKLRILEAHYDYRGLVIRKSDFLSFVNGDAAIASMDILASFMCSKMIGNTIDPHIMTKPGATVPPLPGDKPGREIRSRELISSRVGSFWRGACDLFKSHSGYQKYPKH